ncbi:MAG: bifunctional folylpolyglutamate synthase/dihydrofolate synthase [Verrucomicrobia subdivision 3 bacterium]|nr:bifunctional folylpolyglutamate synthase/dihydrofolate synthase [Verrucomicrobiota bacterium]MCC6820343.1 bifunctional folylpolyglutamate synthase/dihydrofolate synthase [Limisphaerales bacterium]
MTYTEAIQFLYGLGLFGARFGLETTRTLAERAGNPQDRLRFIHVAGTNGKGSTCAILESIYRATGLRVGLFTSPHLVSFRERIQVNRKLISEADVVRLVSAVRKTSSESRLQAVPEPAKTGTPNEDAHPTLFEFVTVMALRYFAEQECDLVIWETGLGGRLDATNIVTPLASVITNIQLDHQQWLGNTLAEIAAEKAGIIKAGVPVLTATSEPEALAVIQQMAQALRAPLTCVAAVSRFRIPDPTSLPLLGDHQQLNAALALATVDVLQPQMPVSAGQLRTGLAQVNWPGRLQLVTRPGGQQILLDGAHNLAGVEALAVGLRQHFPQARPTLILGMLADKDWRPMCARLAGLATRILTVPVGSERTAKAEELAAVCRATLPMATLECSSLAEAAQRTANDPFIVITGSLYLVGEALELLGLGPAGDPSERGLNDWGGGKSQQSDKY